MTVVTGQFNAEFNMPYEDNPVLVREAIHVGRDLGCTTASGASPVDNYAKLAPAFAYSSRIPRSIYFDGELYAHTQKIVTTHRDGLCVYGGGPSGPWAKENYNHSGAVPGPFEYGGPGGGLVWTGAPGGTMVQANGRLGVWRGVNLQGLWAATGGGAVKENINFSTAAGICFLLSTGDDGIAATPPFYMPGGWGLYDCNLQSAAVGFKAADAYATSHGDQCILHNVGFSSVEDAMWFLGQQSLQFDVTPRIGLMKRLVRLSGGGQITINNPWLGAAYGHTTLLHVENADFNGGNITFNNTQIDATCGANCKVITHGAIGIGSGAQQSAFFTAAAITDASDSLLKARFYGGMQQFGVTAEPLFRLKGGMQVGLYDWWGLENNIFEMEHMTQNWSDLGPVDFTPHVASHGCSFRKNEALSNAPGANSIYQSVGQKYFFGWTGAAWDIGGPIVADAVDTT